MLYHSFFDVMIDLTRLVRSVEEKYSQIMPVSCSIAIIPSIKLLDKLLR